MRLSLYSLVFGNHLKAKEAIFGHFNKIIAFLYKFFLTSSMRPPPKKKSTKPIQLLMNLLAAMGTYYIFLSKPAVNFDYEVSNSDGQLTIWQ